MSLEVKGSAPGAAPCSMRDRVKTGGRVLWLVTLLALSACERGAESGVRAHGIRSADLGQLVLGRTTSSDVERLFGAPQERALDGALTYRNTLPSRHRQSRTETVTFRFTDGVLARICRTRS
jgi:hypothetical protein